MHRRPFEGRHLVRKVFESSFRIGFRLFRNDLKSSFFSFVQRTRVTQLGVYRQDFSGSFFYISEQICFSFIFSFNLTLFFPERSGFTAFNASLVFGLSSFVLRDLHNHGVQFYEWDKYAPTISKFEGLHDYTLREDRPPYTGWEWK